MQSLKCVESTQKFFKMFQKQIYDQNWFITVRSNEILPKMTAGRSNN